MCGTLKRVCGTLKRMCGTNHYVLCLKNQITTTASGPKMALMKSLGATNVINYREEAFEEKLHDYDIV